MPKILHQRSKCIGCNLCYEIWPLRWRLSRADGKCTLVEGIEKKGIWQVVVSGDELVPNRKAAAACPVKIIRVTE
jgi:ferredoxin